MAETPTTYVITLEEDVAEFLDIKNKSVSELNTYINQLLHQEEQRQKQQRGQRSKSQPGEDWAI